MQLRTFRPIYIPGIAAVIMLILVPWLAAQDTVPAGMTYQGRITGTDGNPAPDGTGYAIEVRLWNAPTDGTLVWGARYSNVQVQGGAFNVILGAAGGEPVEGAAVNDLSFAFNSPERYIGLTVLSKADGTPIPSPTEIFPRQQILSVPYAVQASLLNGKRADELSPAGTVVAFAGNSAPKGWAICDGSPLSSIEYPALSSAIGEHWGDGGDGDGPLFDLPNLSGRNIIGAGVGAGLTQRTAGQFGGEENHTLTIAEMPAHTHDYVVGGHNDVRDANSVVFSPAPASDPTSYPPYKTLSTGSGAPHNNMPPFAVLNYIIKL